MGREGNEQAGDRSLEEGLAAMALSEQELRVLAVELHVQNEELEAVRQELEMERERYRDLFEFAPDGYLITDLDTVIQEANRAAGELLRRPAGELGGQRLLALMAPADVPRFYPQLERLLGGQEPPLSCEVQLLPAAGPAVSVALRVAAAGRGTLRWLVRDVSDQKRSEGERELLLRQVQEQRDTVEMLMRLLEQDWGTLQTIMDNTETCLAYVDRDLEVRRANLAYTRAWQGNLPAPVKGGCGALLEQVRDTGQRLDFRAQPVDTPESTRYWDCSLVPVRDATGHIQGVVLSLADVTPQVEMRQIMAQKNRELQDLVRELDAFAHTVAHDLKQPLASALGLADLLSECLPEVSGAEAEEMLRYLKQGIRKMNDLLEALLLLASTQGQDIEIEDLDMEQVVAGALRSVESLVAELGGEIVVPATWPPVRGVGLWVESVWVNYVSNALKYGGRPPRVELGFDSEPVPPPTGRPPAIRFWVRDNGAGLSPEQQDRLFRSATRLGRPAHLGQSTERTRTYGYASPSALPRGKCALGHGLGLTIVQRIVERLGGQVGVESRPGEGCTFWFSLPL